MVNFIHKPINCFSYFIIFFKVWSRRMRRNDLQISGKLHSVDQYLNIKLTNVTANDTQRYPHLVLIYKLSVVNCFVRGSVVRYVFFNPSDINTEELQELCRRQAMKLNLDKSH
ncbi:U6 snRNP protein Lsm2, putative [Theileria annulata]|uniref:U6 snRNP protein Lsm2, putative n=1 Tax=Theileria annulata TaxID=5874 RepID=Q4UA02_THEAN|nr:U6 snRNP protein Lsm2, putative [Theileria annulata]CAI76351.1 U6 snRNP protein Lsm2, putative [Theileria annulata]|eukprot:XP_952975.1 U6 snRNP protein Lsm2, putative [Theileria annulata]